jgi:membrane protein implicated in regulation of membrane protease activity
MHQWGGAAVLWEWHYLVFVLPFAMGAFLLLLSGLKIGGGGHHAGHHMGPVHTSTHLSAGGHHAGSAITHAPAGRAGRTTEGARSAGGPTPLSITLLLLGVGRAPLPTVAEFFLICYGIAGFWANTVLLRSVHPGLLALLPSFAVAMVGGIVGSRFAAEVVGRLMPRDETSVVSNDALYGLTGRVVYAVGEANGRVHLYDEFGTLHDETCRIAPGRPTIAKGQTVRIVDRDAASGNLIVEEAPGL